MVSRHRTVASEVHWTRIGKQHCLFADRLIRLGRCMIHGNVDFPSHLYRAGLCASSFSPASQFRSQHVSHTYQGVWAQLPFWRDDASGIRCVAFMCIWRLHCIDRFSIHFQLLLGNMNRDTLSVYAWKMQIHWKDFNRSHHSIRYFLSPDDSYLGGSTCESICL